MAVRAKWKMSFPVLFLFIFLNQVGLFWVNGYTVEGLPTIDDRNVSAIRSKRYLDYNSDVPQIIACPSADLDNQVYHRRVGTKTKISFQLIGSAKIPTCFNLFDHRGKEFKSSSDNRVRVNVNGNRIDLEIAFVKTEDFARFRIVGKIDDTKFFLAFVVRPWGDYNPGTYITTEKEGLRTKLSCPIENKFNQTIQWKKNGVAIKPDKDFQFVNGDLSIVSPKLINEGVYTCEVNDQSRAILFEIERETRLIDSGRTFYYQPIYGQKFQLVCVGIGSNLTYRWRKMTVGGGGIVLGDTPNRKINRKEGTMTFNEIAEMDNGKYECSVIGKIMTDVSWVNKVLYYVRVQDVGPEIIRFEIVGDSIECEVFGNPLPTKVYLINTKTAFEPETVTNYNLTEMRYIISTKVSGVTPQRLVGEIACIVKKGFEVTAKSVIHTVYENKTLIQGYAPKMKLTYELGRVTCSIDSDPFPEYAYIRKDRVVQGNVTEFISETYDLVLPITDLRYGTYSCSAGNIFGNSDISTWSTIPPARHSSICENIPQIYKPDFDDLSVCFTGKDQESRRKKRSGRITRSKARTCAKPTAGETDQSSEASTSRSFVEEPPEKKAKVIPNIDNYPLDRDIVDEKLWDELFTYDYGLSKVSTETLEKGIPLATDRWKEAGKYEGTCTVRRKEVDKAPRFDNNGNELRLLMIKQKDGSLKPDKFSSKIPFFVSYIKRHVVSINGSRGHQALTMPELEEKLSERYGISPFEFINLRTTCQAEWGKAEQTSRTGALGEEVRNFGQRWLTINAFLGECMTQRAKYIDSNSVNKENLDEKVATLCQDKLSKEAQTLLVARFKNEFALLPKIDESSEDPKVLYHGRYHYNEAKYVFREMTYKANEIKCTEETIDEEMQKINNEKENQNEKLSKQELKKKRIKYEQIWEKLDLLVEGESNNPLRKRCLPYGKSPSCFTRPDYIIWAIKHYLNEKARLSAQSDIPCTFKDCPYTTSHKSHMTTHERRHELKNGVNDPGISDLRLMSPILIPRQKLLPQKGTATSSDDIKSAGTKLFKSLETYYQLNKKYYTTYSDYSVIFIHGDVIKGLNLKIYNIEPKQIDAILTESTDPKYMRSKFYYGSCSAFRYVCSGMRQTIFKDLEAKGYYGFKISQNTFHGDDPIKLKLTTFIKEAFTLMSLFMRFNFFEDKEKFDLLNIKQELLPLFELAKDNLMEFVKAVTFAFRFASSGKDILVLTEPNRDDYDNVRLPIKISEVTPLRDYESSNTNCGPADDEDGIFDDITITEMGKCNSESDSETSSKNPVHKKLPIKLESTSNGPFAYKAFLDKFIEEMKDYIIEAGSNLSYYLNIYWIIPKDLEAACPLHGDPNKLFDTKIQTCMKNEIKKKPELKIQVYIGTRSDTLEDCVFVTRLNSRYYKMVKEEGATMIKISVTKFKGQGNKLKELVDILEAILQFIFFSKDTKFVNPTPYKIANAHQEHLPLFSYLGIFDGITAEEKTEGNANFWKLWDFASESSDVKDLFEMEDELNEDEDNEEGYDQKEVDFDMNSFFPIMIKKRMLKLVRF